ncbi:MAG: hypothetical protein HYW07_11535, partial [Candidatus Latescibacteria bacterium]|nr:hypothetical protein [Candidatus Latescibacterota bacterium]
MSASVPPEKGRILGLPKTRLPLVAVQIWTPPSQAEVAAMPGPPLYPTDKWDQARAVLQESIRDRQVQAERAAREQKKQRTAEEPASRLPIEPMPQEKRREGVTAPPPPAETVVTERLDYPSPPPAAGGAHTATPEGHSRAAAPSDGEPASVHQLVRQRPEDAAQMVRTLLIEAEGQGPSLPSGQLPAMARVAVLFVGLGQDLSGEVLKYLSDYAVEEITQAIANLKNVSVAQQDKVLEEFKGQLLAGAWVGQGGIDFARQVLERGVGPRKAQEILDRVMHTTSSGFFMLKNVAPSQLAPFISQEHPQTIAL